jgi:CRISPR-associated Csx2 family protein
MPTTLISAIGRGRKDDDGTSYKTCAYEIDGQAAANTCFFVSAWLQSTAGADVDTVELVGTATSTWDALAEEYGDAELWAALEERCGDANGPGVRDCDLLPLARLLSRTWGRQVRCHVLCYQAVDDTSAGDVLQRLLGLFPIDDDARQIQLDTTHGFRTLPLLALSAVQMADALQPGLAARTRLLYGELLGSRARGYALDSVLAQQGLADAARAFFDGFDGDQLAALLEGPCPQLGRAIRDLSACLQANAFNRVAQHLAQLRNALDRSGCEHLPYGPLLARRLRQLIEQLDKPRLADQLLALARLRAARRHYGTALLTLAEAATALACPERVAEFEDMKRAGNIFAKRLSGEHDAAWRELFRARNRIAHGANLVDQKGQLTAQNLRLYYERGERLLRQLCR